MSYEAVRAAAETTGELALVTVVEVTGSAPRHAGSKMVVRRISAGGVPRLAVVAGTVGGGKGEARAIALAGECISARAARLLTLEFQGTEIEGPDMICGGTSRLLVEPLEEDRAPYRLALERLRRGERTLFVKTLGGAPAVAVLDEHGRPLYGTVPPSVGPHVAQALAAGRALLLPEDEVFVDPVFPDEKLLVLGGGYVGQAVAWHAARLGFTVTVADDRPEFSGAERFPPGVATLCGPYTETVGKFPFDSATYVVMVTRGHLTDLECVRAVLRRRWRYAGFIGSARKARLLREQLSRDGFDPAAIGQLHSPIGIRIGAETPEELAVSILAQMISVRRGAFAPPPGSPVDPPFDRPAANA